MKILFNPFPDHNSQLKAPLKATPRSDPAFSSDEIPKHRKENPHQPLKTREGRMRRGRKPWSCPALPGVHSVCYAKVGHVYTAYALRNVPHTYLCRTIGETPAKYQFGFIRYNFFSILETANLSTKRKAMFLGNAPSGTYNMRR